MAVDNQATQLDAIKSFLSITHPGCSLEWVSIKLEGVAEVMDVPLKRRSSTPSAAEPADGISLSQKQTRILEWFCPLMGTSERVKGAVLAAVLGIPIGTLRREIAPLVTLGFLTSDPDAGGYGIGENFADRMENFRGEGR